MGEEESDSMELDDEPEFTLAEILEMDSLYKEMGVQTFNQAFCEKLATKFSQSTHRSGKPSIGWEKVHCWFQEKQAHLVAKVNLPLASNEVILPKTALIKSRVPSISATEAAEMLPNLAFEARSAKDYAWFDVASFLTYKVLNSGEMFVRVRFAGFGKEEDEWVSVRNAVRERSIPLEQSECKKVKVGDLVLCFKETEYHALYTDAHVIEIERREHDNNECTCTFLVVYEFDTTQKERVPLRKICCRPEKSAPKGSEESRGLEKLLM